MEKLSILILLVSLFVATPEISFGIEDGNQLLDECSHALKGPESYGLNFIAASRCFGYLEGITSTSFLYQRRGTETLFCLPENSIQNIEATKIVVKYLENHPEQLHKHKLILAIDAFTQAYPCP